MIPGVYLCNMIKLKDLVYNRSKEFWNWFGERKLKKVVESGCVGFTLRS